MSPVSGITSGNVLCSQACAKTSPLGGATQGDVLLQEANAKTKHLISSGWCDPGEMPCFPRFRQTNISSGSCFQRFMLKQDISPGRRCPGETSCFQRPITKIKHLHWAVLPKEDVSFQGAYTKTRHLPWVAPPKGDVWFPEVYDIFPCLVARSSG